MRKTVAFLLAAGMVAILAGCDNSSSTSATFDLTGTWRAILSPTSSSGPCPAGRFQMGTATISQSGTGFNLNMGAGFDCRPAGACAFQGTVDGVRYTASNSGTADGEGGKYANSIVMDASTKDVVQGFLSSTYTHPEMRCSWESTFVLSR